MLMELSEMIYFVEKWLYEFKNDPNISKINQISDPECKAYEITYEEFDKNADDMIHRCYICVFSNGIITENGKDVCETGLEIYTNDKKKSKWIKDFQKEIYDVIEGNMSK